MDTKKTRFAVMILALLLAGCAGGKTTQPAKSTPGGNTGTRPDERPMIIPPRGGPQTPSGMKTPFRKPQLMVLPGAESILGASVSQLTSQLGPPRLEVVEGDVRKLQFQGPACVLDIYLYPMSQGAEPRATYIDARRASDGLDVDRIACINAMKAKQP